MLFWSKQCLISINVENSSAMTTESSIKQLLLEIKIYILIIHVFNVALLFNASLLNNP